MRRKDREVRDTEELLQIIDSCQVCRIAMRDGEDCYLVPLNYGYTYEDGTLTLYFHCAREGKKIDLLRQNSRVSFELDCDGKLIPGGEIACNYGYQFASVIGRGTVCFLEETDEKKKALAILMRHQTGRDFPDFQDAMVRAVCTFALKAETFSGKRCVRLD